MKRIFAVLAVAALVATMLALAGPSLAATTQQKKQSYSDSVNAKQYFAKPIINDGDTGGSWFRGKADDIATDQDPGLPGG